jgi:predicted CoA-binding protein
MQEGLYSEEIESLVTNAGLKVVMNKCPKKILDKESHKL